MKYYYADNNNQTAGPAALDEIRALVASGKLPADPMIVAEGASDWKPLSGLGAVQTSAVPPKNPAPAQPGAPAARDGGGAGNSGGIATIMSDTVEKFVGVCSRMLSPERLNCALRCSRNYGHYALLAGAALVLAYSLFLAIRHNSFGHFLVGAGCVIALVVGQFVAVQFLGAGEKLIASTPSRLSSNAVMKCLGLIAVVTAVVCLALGVIGAIQERSVLVLIPALVTAVLLVSAGAVALNPSSVNVEIGQGSAGEEAVGLIMFFLKTWLKIVPLSFALFAAAGCLVTLCSFFTRVDLLPLLTDMLPVPVPQIRGMDGASLLILACIIPLIAYLYFLFASLILDVLRAILVVPSKLDSLRR